MRSRTPSAAAVKLLAELLRQPQAFRYGYELMNTIGLQAGTLYPLLARLHDRGLLQAEWRASIVDGRPPRHTYRLTSAGIVYAVEHAPKPRAGRLRHKTRLA